MPESLPGSTTALRVQLATALRERDEARALKLEEVMGATKRVCDERDAANARADAIELARVVLLADERREKHRADAAQEALAAARRECEDARRVIFMLVTQAGGEVVIGGSVMVRHDDARASIETSRDPGGDLRIRAVLTAPRDGER